MSKGRKKMIVLKMSYLDKLPENCDDCVYKETSPDPFKGWTEYCYLCHHCLDDDQPDEWIFDGDERPKACPLIEVKENEQ